MITGCQFTSRINEDDGTQHRFLGHAHSSMVFDLYDETGLAGFILWEYRFIDGKYVNQFSHTVIELWFDRNKRLVDFGGVFELPVEAILMLEHKGYNMEFAKQ
jgi:hypothetical protein